MTREASAIELVSDSSNLSRKYILLVENSSSAAEEAVESISPIKEVVFKRIASEHQFLTVFERIAQEPPALVIAEADLRWDYPSKDSPQPPAEIMKEGSGLGGWRCLVQLATDFRTREVPKILWTYVSRRFPQNPDGISVPHNILILPRYGGNAPDDLRRSAMALMAN